MAVLEEREYASLRKKTRLSSMRLGADRIILGYYKLKVIKKFNLLLKL
jgi:hypothetical protein